MKRILFVCTGNTCRSSMAEGLFKAGLAHDEELSKEYTAASAGLAALEGDPASYSSVKVLLDEWGIDISSHRAKLLSEELVRNSDLILTMTRSHKQAILSMFPGAADRVYTLKEFASGSPVSPSMEEYNYSLDITDPYGMSDLAYKRCAKEIKEAVDKLVSKLV